MANNGNYQALYVNGQRIALTKSNDFSAKKAFADITTKDSQGNKEVLPTLNECSATLEGIATSSLVNKLQFPENFSNAAWTNLSVTISGTKVVNPFNQKLAQSVTWSSGSNLHQVIADLYFSIGNVITFSVYVKGTGTITITTGDDDNDTTSSSIPLTSSWVRHEVSHTLTSATGCFVEITQTNGSAITVFGPQLELGAAATMYKGSTQTFSDLQTFAENNTKVTIIQSDYIDGDIQVSYEGYISDLQIKSTHDDAETFTCNFEGTGVQTSSTI
jgi:predicted secreted protein